MELSVAGRVTVVTGASKGIGRAVALELAGAGADLVVCARGAAALEAVAEEIRGAPYAAAKAALINFTKNLANAFSKGDGTVTSFAAMVQRHAATHPGKTAVVEAHELSRRKLPERLEVVGELPVTASGKVQKHVLRERIARLRAEKPA